MMKGLTGARGIAEGMWYDYQGTREDNRGFNWHASECQIDVEAVWPCGLPRA